MVVVAFPFFQILQNSQIFIRDIPIIPEKNGVNPGGFEGKKKNEENGKKIWISGGVKEMSQRR